MPYRHSVSVAGAVYNPANDAFLVIQRADTGDWQLPGGILEQDETIQECVVREVFEETGINVIPTRLSGIYKNMKLGVVALVFLCEAKGGTPMISDESNAVEWFPRHKVLETMPPAFACRLLDVFEPVPPTRSHDGTAIL